MQGIFCGNFGVSRDGFLMCRSAWHPECYTCLVEGVFPMRRVVDEDGNPWHNNERRIKDLNTGVAGAHCCIPFQCEDCWIRNLEYRNPCRLDGMYLMSIRRANLDAMNGKARSTINGHCLRTQRLVNNSVRINKTPSLAPRGPFLLCDQVAMGLAVDINQESLVARGRNEPTVQAETLQKMQSTYTKNWESSPAGVAEGAAFSSGKGRIRATSCPSQSEWYYDTWRGMEARLGHISRANHGLPMTAMIAAISAIEQEARSAEMPEESNYF